MIAPIRHKPANPTKPWEGNFPRKPWDYEVTAVIPHLDTPELLKICVELLRLQTARPYILIIDTGSNSQVCEQIENLRGADCEIHYVRSHAYIHPSDPVAIGMDLAQALCMTRFMFCTHSDCFLKRRDLLEDLIARSQENDNPCVGYQLSPRKHADWEWMVGHTCTLLDVRFLDKHGITWSQRRLCRENGVAYTPRVVLSKEGGRIQNPAEQPNWPDTELAVNYGLDKAGKRPLIIGAEKNYERNNGPDFDHIRSYVSLQMYEGKNAPRRVKSEQDMVSAVKDAKKRILLWKATRQPGNEATSEDQRLAA